MKPNSNAGTRYNQKRAKESEKSGRANPLHGLRSLLLNNCLFPRLSLGRYEGRFSLPILARKVAAFSLDSDCRRSKRRAKIPIYSHLAVKTSNLPIPKRQIESSRNRKLEASMNQDEIVALGASLHRIDCKLLKPEKEFGHQRLWYQGDEPYFDLFFEVKNNEIIWFQLTFRGKSVSWSCESSALQTGITNELTTDDVSYYSASKLINSDSIPDREFIEFARAILKSRTEESIFKKALALFDSPA